MKKFLFLAGMVFLLSPAFANEPALLQIRSIQSQIDDCGAKILNATRLLNLLFSFMTMRIKS